MKNYRIYIYSILFAASILSCDDDYVSNSADASVVLTVPGLNIKSPGHGQYKMQTETGKDVSVTASVPGGIRSLSITKTVNLSIDNTFGTNGVLTLTPSGTDALFTYVPVQKEVDQLVGFTFRAEGSDGSSLTSDLQLIVTLSPRDNIPTKKWLFTDKVYVDNNNAPDIRECEKDNYMFFNADGTIDVDYGAMTGAGNAGCEFDGFNVYDSWELSEDEKMFTIVYHNLFNEAQITTDVYRVKALSFDKLQLELDIDLSWLGLGTEETFFFEYTAVSK